MKILLLPCLLAGLLFTTGCDKVTDLEPKPEPVICFLQPAVKTVTDQQGTMRYNSTTKQYAIIVTRSSVTGSVDVGVLQQTLSKEVQVDGQEVIFSGTYYEKPGAPTSGDVAEYYLQVDKIAVK